MAIKKTVAAPESEATIPEIASTVGELEATEPVTVAEAGASKRAPVTPAAVAKHKIEALARARAAKAAKAAARREAEESINAIQLALAEEQHNDRAAFGEIREVAKIMPTREEYVKVEMPSTDLFDHTHPGVQLNRHKFEPGKTYLLRGDVALEVKKRLALFHDEQVRLLRPNADRKALADVNRGSQWSSRGSSSVVPLGRLSDLPVASDEKIYTVDFD